MKNFITLLLFLVLASCGEPCSKDTEFGIKYKTIDGSWEGPLYWDLPHDAHISVFDNNGAYYLGYTSECSGYHLPVRLRNAVVDHRIVKKTFLYDTTKTKVELITPDTLK